MVLDQVLWHALKLGQFLSCCARGVSKLGASDAVHSFPARSLGQWHRHSWNCLALGVPMVYVLLHEVERERLRQLTVSARNFDATVTGSFCVSKKSF